MPRLGDASGHLLASIESIVSNRRRIWPDSVGAPLPQVILVDGERNLPVDGILNLPRRRPLLLQIGPLDRNERTLRVTIRIAEVDKRLVVAIRGADTPGSSLAEWSDTLPSTAVTFTIRDSADAPAPRGRR